MNLFQVLAGGFMLLLVFVECYLQLVGQARRLIGGIRLCVWLLAAGLIIFPGTTNALAQLLSIGRGADVLLYFTVLAFLMSFFYVIHALERQREQLTFLVRNIAITAPAHAPTAEAESSQSQSRGGDTAELADTEPHTSVNANPPS